MPVMFMAVSVSISKLFYRYVLMHFVFKDLYHSINCFLNILNHKIECFTKGSRFNKNNVFLLRGRISGS